MNNLWWNILKIIDQSWFWQGIIINTSFALASIPFTYKMFQKSFKNRKGNRQKNALSELNKYCLKHLVRNKKINKDDFENQLYLIANKYKLDIKDLYNDNFFENLIHTIIEIDLIDNKTKEKIADKIRKDRIFSNTNNESGVNENHDSILFKERTYSHSHKDDVQLNKNEIKDIFKYTSITTVTIFMVLLLYTFLYQVLIGAYGLNSIIFINTIIIIVMTIPILANGIISFAKFNKHNKIYFLFLLIILILNIINLIFIVEILLYGNVFFR